MGTKNKENQKNEAKKKVDKEVFKEIETRFKQYWKVLLILVVVYIISYLLWSKVIANVVRNFLDSRGLGGEEAKKSRTLVIVVAVIQGILFSLDGWITSTLKSPFNQMCYSINKAEGIGKNKKEERKKKDYIITKATESNEHCKETLKKFGVLTIGVELFKVFLKGLNLKKSNIEDSGKYYDWINISFIIPLCFAALAIFLIHRELKKIRKEIK